MLTLTDLINARISAAGLRNESDIIRYILEDDLTSPQKKNMADGERYYAAEHDVLQKNFNQGVVEETAEEENGEESVRKPFSNPNRSNHHNVNPFHQLLVDQKVAYIAGREPTISVAGAEEDAGLKEYQEIVSRVSDENFNEMLQNWILGASNKGFEVLHFYYDTDGNLQYCIIPAEEIIPVYDSQFQRELVEVIRYYSITVVKGGVRYQRRKVEWWTAENVTYYTEREKDLYIRDPAYPVNPAPHWWDVDLENGMEKQKTAHSWGRVPFVILENNRNRTTDLQPIKGLIDGYDLISSEGTNTLLDLVELYWVIQG